MQNIVPMTRNFLEFRLGQSLTLTPALQQSIRLLQLSTLDLEAEVAKALAENPLLEQEGEGLQDPGAPGSTGRVDQAFEGPVDPSEASQADIEGSTATSLEGDPSFERERPEFSTESRHSRDDELTERPEAARESNLREYLLSQLGTTRLSQRDAAIVSLLIEELNEDGFLASPLEEIVGWMRPELGLELDDFQLGLTFLQSLDPPGVAARNLGECLDLQLQYADPDR